MNNTKGVCGYSKSTTALFAINQDTILQGLTETVILLIFFCSSELSVKRTLRTPRGLVHQNLAIG
jgi:hypothetical protein